MPGEGRGVRLARPRWRAAIFVCGKCLKRHPDGKRLRRALKDELKRQSTDTAKTRRVRIVRTACVGLCPKRAVVMASAATLAAGETVLVDGREAMPAAVAHLVPRGRD